MERSDPSQVNPMSTATDPTVVARRNLVAILMAYPLRCDIVARVLNTMDHNIRNDEKVLRQASGVNACFDRSYNAQLECYMQASQHQIEGLTADIQDAVARELAVELKLVEAETYALALFRGMELGRMTKIPFDLRWTQQMVDVIYGTLSSGNRDSSYKPEWTFKFSTALECWYRERNCKPNDYSSLAETLVMYARYGRGVQSDGMYLFTSDDVDLGTLVHTVITSATAEAVATAYGTLTERQREVINLRVPKDGGEGASFSGISTAMGIAIPKIKEIWAEALKKMREYLLEHHDIARTSVKADDVAKISANVTRLKLLEIENAVLRQRPGDTEIPAEGEATTAVAKALGTSVDDVDMTVEAAIRCNAVEFRFIWQLAEETEFGLNKKGFRPRRVGEIKRILEGLGLSLGMKIPQEVKEYTKSR